MIKDMKNMIFKNFKQLVKFEIPSNLIPVALLPIGYKVKLCSPNLYKLQFKKQMKYSAFYVL